MILIIGASGKTGKAVLKALVKRDQQVRTMVRRQDQIAMMKDLGAADVVVGDIRSLEDLQKAAQGVAAVYYICPNAQPDELVIGQMALAAAREAGVSHFVYHSVLHPQTEAMPHHWQKLRVEEKVFESGLPFTLLQPCAYMQNILANKRQILEQGIYPVPYSVNARLSIVDLDDVAEAAAVVLSEPNHVGAIYELAGKDALTQVEVAQILSDQLHRPVEAVTVDRTEWETRSRASGLDEYAIQTLLKMFVYYENYGLWGNSRALEGLLSRPPRSFAEFVQRQMQ